MDYMNYMNYEYRIKGLDVELEIEFNGEVFDFSRDGNQRVFLYVNNEYRFWGAVDKKVFLTFDDKG